MTTEIKRNLNGSIRARRSSGLLFKAAYGCDRIEISNHIEIYGGDSAKKSCGMYKDARRGGVPERGAFVFYDCLCPGENGPVNFGL